MQYLIDVLLLFALLASLIQGLGALLFFQQLC